MPETSNTRPIATIVLHDVSRLSVTEDRISVMASLLGDVVPSGSPRRFKRADGRGGLVLELFADGRCHAPTQKEEQKARAHKMLAQCLLLDDARVQNGDKAIDIAMHGLWTDAHREAFGEPDPPGTIRRWRAERGREGERTMADMSRRRLVRRDRRSMPERVQAFRRRQAHQVVSSGETLKRGYATALRTYSLEVEELGADATAPSSRPPFSYATFRRVDGHRHPVRVAMQFRELERLLREGVFVSVEDADAQGSLDATGE